MYVDIVVTLDCFPEMVHHKENYLTDSRAGCAADQ